MTREEQIQRESEIYAWTANQFDCGLAFRKGAEWADKTMLERVCKWLKDNSHEYICSAPTQNLLQRWLREEKGIIVIPYYRSVLRMWSATYELTRPYTFEDLRKCFKTYELALEDALKYALENLVQQDILPQ